MAPNAGPASRLRIASSTLCQHDTPSSSNGASTQNAPETGEASASIHLPSHVRNTRALALPAGGTRIVAKTIVACRDRASHAPKSAKSTHGMPSLRNPRRKRTSAMIPAIRSRSPKGYATCRCIARPVPVATLVEECAGRRFRTIGSEDHGHRLQHGGTHRHEHEVRAPMRQRTTRLRCGCTPTVHIQLRAPGGHERPAEAPCARTVGEQQHARPPVTEPLTRNMPSHLRLSDPPAAPATVERSTRPFALVAGGRGQCTMNWRIHPIAMLLDEKGLVLRLQ
ncbi:hypothetical protein [Dokdonella fugitiva]|uniref:hypothetical protein n=1 Tax=Dokdonella fugitiva TaxID=328517 RepID=UPI0015FA1A5C|nr:hypothetical protein [Dokdonella fugitiva]MBA8883589.1 hypothetical protein [Dokdonella fugitiva]